MQISGDKSSRIEDFGRIYVYISVYRENDIQSY